MDEEERYRVNVFDWKMQFDAVFKGAGGFDAVIGNPPYVRQESLGDQKAYFQMYYKTCHGSADLYVYFIEKGVCLLKSGGIFCYIVANKWMRAHYGQPLRKWMQQHDIQEIIDFGDLPVFENATTYPCILRIRRSTKPAGSIRALQVKTLDFPSLDEYVHGRTIRIYQQKLDPQGWTLCDMQTVLLLEKLRSKGIALEEYVNGKIFRGILTGFNDAFVIDKLN